MRRAILISVLFLWAGCRPSIDGRDGGVDGAPTAPRSDGGPAPRSDGALCVVDEDCPGDSRSVRRCILGLCADLGCDHDHARCDDGDPCTVDRCADTLLCENRPNGICCRADSGCDDGDDCTIDRCEDETCAHELAADCRPCDDFDGDGHAGDTCGGDDCNDINPRVSPDADEICDVEGDEDCDGLRDIDDRDCQPPTASCDGRVVLTSGAVTPGTVVSTTSHACGGSAFFEIPLPGESDVELVLTLDAATPFIGSGFDVHGVDLAVLLETSCGDPATSLFPIYPTCDTYPTAFSSSRERRLFARRVPAGQVFAEIRERLQAGVPGGPELDFTVQATVRPAERPRCEDAPVALGTTTHFVAPAHDGVDCFSPWVGVAYARARERIHAFTLGAASRVRARATTSDASITRLGITESCDADTARATCEESIGGTCQGFALLERILPAGTHYAVVEASADYDLAILADPVDPSCGDAPSIVLDGPPATGDTTGRSDAFQYTGAPFYDRVCGGATGPDVVYALTLASEVDVEIEAHTEFRSLLRLLDDCGGDTLWADSGGSMVRHLAPGTYFVVIDGADPAEHGAYTLAVRSFAP